MPCTEVMEGTTREAVLKQKKEADKSQAVKLFGSISNAKRHGQWRKSRREVDTYLAGLAVQYAQRQAEAAGKGKDFANNLGTAMGTAFGRKRGVLGRLAGFLGRLAGKRGV